MQYCKRKFIPEASLPTLLLYPSSSSTPVLSSLPRALSCLLSLCGGHPCVVWSLALKYPKFWRGIVWKMGFTAGIWCRKLKIRLLLSNLSHELAVVSALAGLLKSSYLGTHFNSLHLHCIQADKRSIWFQVYSNFIKIQNLLLVEFTNFKNIRHLHIYRSLGQRVTMSLWNTDSRHSLFLLIQRKAKKKVKQLFQICFTWEWKWSNLSELHWTTSHHPLVTVSIHRCWLN